MSRVAVTAFTLGALLMLAFDTTLTRIAGVLLLFAGIGFGAASIATPDFLGSDDDS